MKSVKWTIIFGALGLFSIVTLGTLFNFGTSAAYADAIGSDTQMQNQSNFVSYTPSGSSSPEVCTINRVEINELRQVPGISVSIIRVKVKGKIVKIAKVTGVTDKKITKFLSENGESSCTAVHIDHIFFLPVIPSIS